MLHVSHLGVFCPLEMSNPCKTFHNPYNRPKWLSMGFRMALKMAFKHKFEKSDILNPDPTLLDPTQLVPKADTKMLKKIIEWSKPFYTARPCHVKTTTTTPIFHHLP